MNPPVKTPTTIEERKQKLMREIKESIIKSSKHDDWEKQSLITIVNTFEWSYLELERLYTDLKLG